MQQDEAVLRDEKLSKLDAKYLHMAENWSLYSGGCDNRVDWINVVVRRTYLYFTWIKSQNLSIDYSDRSKLLELDKYNLLKLSGMPKFRRISLLLRLIQKIFFWYRWRDVLHICDWSSNMLASKRKDTLLYNSIRPWSGYYLIRNRQYIQKYSELIGVEYNINSINIHSISEKLKNNGCDLSDTEIKEYSYVLQTMFEINVDVIVEAYALYDELLSYYKPKLIAIPGETFFGNIILTQLARQYGIKTLLVIDGYQTINCNDFYKDYLGKKYIFDYFAAFGSGNRDLLNKEYGIPVDNIVTLKAPILSLVSNKKQAYKDIDVLVMAYTPTISLSCKYIPEKTTIDVVNCLTSQGYKNVWIKMKQNSHFTSKEVMSELIEKYIDSDINIHFVYGQMSDTVKRAKLVIGQISTALFETTYCSIPYIVYEPYENGKFNSEVYSSTILNNKYISRDLKSLANILANNFKSIKSDYDYLFSGDNYESVSLEKFKI